MLIGLGLFMIWCIVDLGAIIEVYLLEACGMAYAVAFVPSMGVWCLELPIYEIILDAQGSKGAITCPFTNPK